MTKEESYIARILNMYGLDNKIQTNDIEVANMFVNVEIEKNQNTLIAKARELCR